MLDRGSPGAQFKLMFCYSFIDSATNPDAPSPEVFRFYRGGEPELKVAFVTLEM